MCDNEARYYRGPGMPTCTFKQCYVGHAKNNNLLLGITPSVDSESPSSSSTTVHAAATSTLTCPAPAGRRRATSAARASTPFSTHTHTHDTHMIACAAQIACPRRQPAALGMFAHAHAAQI